MVPGKGGQADGTALQEGGEGAAQEEGGEGVEAEEGSEGTEAEKGESAQGAPGGVRFQAERGRSRSDPQGRGAGQGDPVRAVGRLGSSELRHQGVRSPRRSSEAEQVVRITRRSGKQSPGRLPFEPWVRITQPPTHQGLKIVTRVTLLHSVRCALCNCFQRLNGGCTQLAQVVL